MPDVPSLPFLLHIAYRDAETRIFEAVRASGVVGFTTAQARIGQGIDEEGTRLSVLAERAGVAKQTATALVDRLEAGGFVERVADPSDGRARLVRMTDRGRRLVPVARAEEQAIERDWEAHLGPELMASLREALTRLREIADPWAP